MLPALLLAAAACGDSTAPAGAELRPPDRPLMPPPLQPEALTPRGLRLYAVSDSDGPALAGGAGYAPVVRVTDAQGRPVPNLAVRFLAGQGGRAAFERATTDADGIASPGPWTAGATLGMQELQAHAGDSAWTRFRLTAVPATGPLAMDGRCPTADSIMPAGWKLPRVAATLGRGQPMTVVAIGSSSTVGDGASTRDSAYPALLERHLVQRFPRSEIRVHNAGMGGQSLATLRARFATDVLARGPQVVVLQTGTIDYMIDVPLETFRVQLRGAIAELQGAGVDVVLLDSQWYPGPGDTERYRQFQETMRAEGAARGVPVVRRFAWMLDMWNRRVYTLAELLGADMFHPSDLTYSCTARMLAEGMVRGVAGTINP